MTNWVINTIAYGDLIENGKATQIDSLSSIAKLEIKTVELRQEYIKNGEQERAELKAAAIKNGLTVFLSIPDVLFLDGNLNADIEQYFKNTQAVGGVQLKLNLGQYYEEALPAQVERIQELINNYHIQLVVENDTTSTTGSAEYFANFMRSAQLDNFGVCFDVGNFLYFDGGDPAMAATILYDDIKYIHLKEVEQDILTPLPYLNQGDVDIKQLLPQLPHDVPIAVECKYEAEMIEAVEVAIKKDIDYLTV